MAAARGTESRGNRRSGDPRSGEESRSARGHTADLRVQLLPDISSWWSKGPSAPGRGQLVPQLLLSERRAPPGWKPRRVSDPDILPHPSSPAPSRPCPPLQADSVSRQQGRPPRPWMRSGRRLLETSHRFPLSLREVTCLKEAPGADTSHLQSTGLAWAPPWPANLLLLLQLCLV